jgi:hypothetical protein
VSYNPPKSIRSTALFQHFTITEMAWASDRQSLEWRLEEDPNVDSEIVNTDATISRILLIVTLQGRSSRFSISSA